MGGAEGEEEGEAQPNEEGQEEGDVDPTDPLYGLDQRLKYSNLDEPTK